MLTPPEQEKACQIGTQIARKRGHTPDGKATLGCLPTEGCPVLVVVIPTRTEQACHIVFEIIYNDQGRVLHTRDLHTGSDIQDDGLFDCERCNGYYACDEMGEEYEEYVEGHLCEGDSFWEDDGKGGFTPCTRDDTQWYEFWLTGTAGWYCPSHWPYDDDMRAIKRGRERAQARNSGRR